MGKSGKGKDYTIYETGVPAIMNHDFLRVASREFIYFTILKGRSQKLMASWNPDVSGFYDEELRGLTTTIKPEIHTIVDGGSSGDEEWKCRQWTTYL